MTSNLKQLELKQLQLTKAAIPFLRPIEATVRGGEILAITGPSGCGKSTLLSAISGSLHHIFTVQGEILLNGDNISDKAIEQRRIGILFQDPLLFPHLTVVENICFADGHGHHEDRMLRAMASLEQVGLNNIAHRYPSEISGGQAARVGLLRTLQAKPLALLLDEPFSKLDSKTRLTFREWVYQIIKQRGIPTLLVTHDEADIPDPTFTLNIGDYSL
ncbi:ATP-binding cassette domain-containing protein [Thaumasiovibrio sp. DFM-14]|uniref:ATP-binding cassette domain-containing protein n=1 Tax=Thaumasiovibrio sp. DFM-14 TaxID=3384792 RepID=UPI00399F5628